MRAGDLDRRVTIRRLTLGADDGYGNQVEEWTDVATLWAEVKQTGGTEFLAAGRIGDETRLTFRVRYLAGITTTDRAVYQGVEHDIVEVRELGRRKGLELFAVKRV